MTEQIIIDTLNSYDEGNIEPLEALTRLKSLRKKLEGYIDMIKEFEAKEHQVMVNYIEQYQGKYKGFELEVRTGRKIFDYSGVSEIREMEKQLKERKLYYKTAFEAHQKNIMMADSDGCEIELPELNYSKGSIIIKENTT